MAFDGLAVAALVDELNRLLGNGRFVKIAQPEKDELIITVKNIKDSYRLLLSADASLPLAYITDSNKTSPLTAPNFCMLLRKHLNNAKIISITQPGLERIINFELEHYNEMGDLCRKKLIVELMGKHSNIIFTDDNGKILDSIKRVNGIMSSVREVLPGRDYFIPDTMGKKNPLDVAENTFTELIKAVPAKISKAIYTSYTGISPMIAEEICYRAGVDSDIPANILTEDELSKVYMEFDTIMNQIKNREFSPVIVYENGVPKEFSPIRPGIYGDLEYAEYDSFSSLLENYYGEKNLHTRIKQRSTDLRRIVQTTLERDYKKYELQMNQMKDTEKKEKYRIYGELLTTYGYGISTGDKSFTTVNYYDGKEVTIPLDPTLSAIENAKKYFDKYSKLKRTGAALEEIIKETKAEIDHLESVSNALDIALRFFGIIQNIHIKAGAAGVEKKAFVEFTRINRSRFVIQNKLHCRQRILGRAESFDKIVAGSRRDNSHGDVAIHETAGYFEGCSVTANAENCFGVFQHRLLCKLRCVPGMSCIQSLAGDRARV